MATVDNIVLPLPRPEYVAAPELLLSSLAWRLASIDTIEAADRPVAMAYRSDKRSSGTMDFVVTEPESPDEWASWSEALDDAGLEYGSELGLRASKGLANAMAGIRARKAKGQPATPLAPSLALLQNARGMMGKKNPPNIGLIVEVLYRLGGAHHQDSAAERWQAAVRSGLERDRLLAILDEAAASALLPGRVVARDAEVLPQLPDLGDRTPFAWFADTWDQLTSADWVEALPSRRWVDWATAVLRMGMSLGYLWEARWYETVARLVVGDPTRREGETWDTVVRAVGPLVPWADATESVSVRDVAPALKNSLRRGAHIRPVLASWTDAHQGVSFEEGLGLMAEDAELISQLEHALATSDNAGTNAWEAVRYALLTRERSGPYADHYGMFETRGRYLLVSPATEWVAVLASLAEGGPGAPTTIGALRRELRRLGLDPSLAELTSLLEAAGLARGSADADQAVVVQSAY